jgi:hypothetical protein
LTVELVTPVRVDTVRFGLWLDVPEDAVERFERVINALDARLQRRRLGPQAGDVEAEVEVNAAVTRVVDGASYEVGYGGKFYGLRYTGADWTAEVGWKIRSAARAKAPHVLITVRAAALAESLGDSISRAERFVRELYGLPEGYVFPQSRLSRVDLCTDVQTDELRADILQRCLLVTRARRRTDATEPNGDVFDPRTRRHWRGPRFSGFEVGSRGRESIHLRIYDSWLKGRSDGNAAHRFAVWEACHWNGLRGVTQADRLSAFYEHREVTEGAWVMTQAEASSVTRGTVWRFEWELGSKPLKVVGLVELGDLLDPEKVLGAWRYLTGDWSRIVVDDPRFPSLPLDGRLDSRERVKGATRPESRPVSPLWAAVAGAKVEGVQLAQRIGPSNLGTWRMAFELPTPLVLFHSGKRSEAEACAARIAQFRACSYRVTRFLELPRANVTLLAQARGTLATYLAGSALSPEGFDLALAQVLDTLPEAYAARLQKRAGVIRTTREASHDEVTSAVDRFALRWAGGAQSAARVVGAAGADSAQRVSGLRRAEETREGTEGRGALPADLWGPGVSHGVEAPASARQAQEVEPSRAASADGVGAANRSRVEVLSVEAESDHQTVLEEHDGAVSRGEGGRGPAPAGEERGHGAGGALGATQGDEGGARGSRAVEVRRGEPSGRHSGAGQARLALNRWRDFVAPRTAAEIVEEATLRAAVDGLRGVALGRITRLEVLEKDPAKKSSAEAEALRNEIESLSLSISKLEGSIDVSVPF